MRYIIKITLRSETFYLKEVIFTNIEQDNTVALFSHDCRDALKILHKGLAEQLKRVVIKYWGGVCKEKNAKVEIETTNGSWYL